MLWIVWARMGVEPAQPANFFDDWSHSFVSVVLLASLFAFPFLRMSRGVFAAIWLAVVSHFLLDFPVHPKRLALYPWSKIHLSWDLRGWGSERGWFGAINDWWLQLFVLIFLLLVYARGMRSQPVPANLIGASCVVLIGVQVLMLSSCISY